MYLLKSRWDIEIYFATLKKKSRMPFILKCIQKKKMFAHCFPAGNYGIIKYIRIPARFQSDSKKVYHLVF